MLYDLFMQDRTVFYTKNVLKDSFSINAIYSVHYFKYCPNFRFDGEKHDFWELVYIDSGKATVVDGDDEYVLTQGNIFIHKPNSPHTIYTKDEFANSVIISFDCNCKNLRFLPSAVFTVREKEKTLLAGVIKEAELAYSDKLGEVYLPKMNKKAVIPFGSDQVIKNSIELLLISLIRGHYENENFSPLLSAKMGSLVDAVVSFLNDRLARSQGFTLKEMSEKLGYSVSYLKSQFKSKTGNTINGYYTQLKLDKAKRLLSTENIPVGEISDALGFSSVHYFCRCFKKNTGMSPREYITSIKTDTID